MGVAKADVFVAVGRVVLLRTGAVVARLDSPEADAFGRPSPGTAS